MHTEHKTTWKPLLLTVNLQHSPLMYVSHLQRVPVLFLSAVSRCKTGRHRLAFDSGNEQLRKLNGETHLEIKCPFMFLLLITLNCSFDANVNMVIRDSS